MTQKNFNSRISTFSGSDNNDDEHIYVSISDFHETNFRTLSLNDICRMSSSTCDFDDYRYTEQNHINNNDWSHYWNW